MKTRVTKDRLDWKAECEEHDEVTWCSEWEHALEAAYGHVAMRHPRNLDTRQDVREGDERA